MTKINNYICNIKNKMKAHNSQGGFALITVVIIISLFLILGTALSMISMANFKLAYKMKGANKAFYLSDGAIEESLNEINDMVFEAKKYANYAVTYPYKFIDENVSVYDIEDEHIKDTFLADYEWQEFIRTLEKNKENGKITEEDAAQYIELGLRCEFLKRYYQFLLKDYYDAKYDDKIENYNFNKNAEVANLSYSLNNDSIKDLIKEHYDEENEDEFFDACIKFKDIPYDADDDTKQNALAQVYVDKIEEMKIAESVDAQSGYAGKPIIITSGFSYTDADDAQKGINVVIKSDGRYNEFKKKLKLELMIVEPDYAYVIKSIQGSINPHKNEVTQYGLISGKYILSTGGKTNVNGNVYSYGVFGDANPHKDTSAGIVLGYSNERDRDGGYLSGISNEIAQRLALSSTGSLDVAGSVMTRSDMLLYGGSDLRVTAVPDDPLSGDLGAGELKHLYVDGSDNDPANVIVARNAYIMEDLEERSKSELNALNMKVGDSSGLAQNGSLYLILSSSSNGENGNNASDHAAAIIVKEEASKNFRLDVNHLFVSGVAFSGLYRNVNVDSNPKKVHYMTGESTNVENRYIDFYKPSSPYNSGISNYDKARYGTAEDDTDPMKMKNGPVLIEDLNDNGVDDVNLKSNIFMNNAKRIKKGGSGYTSAGVDDVYKSMIRINSIEVDSDEETQQLRQNFALGVILAKGKDSDDPEKNNGQLFNPNYSMAINDYGEKLKDDVLGTKLNSNDLDRRINFLSTRNFADDKNELYDCIKEMGDTLVNDIGSSNESNKTRLSQLINFDDDDDNNNIVAVADPNNVCIINTDENNDIYITPPNDIPIGDDDIVLNAQNPGLPNNYKGLIATKGNVYIYSEDMTNPFTFNGLIAAEGSIILFGNGQKNIERNELEVIRQMQLRKKAWDSLHGDDGRKIINLLGGLDSVDGFDVGAIATTIGADELYSITEGKTPVILTIPDNSEVESVPSSPPLLEGTQKIKKLDGYRIIEWKEIR